VAFAASRSQSFFVISSAAERTIVDPAKHARSIQKKPTADLWPVRCNKLGSGGGVGHARSPETTISALAAKRCTRSWEQLVFRPSISTVNTVNKTVIEVHVRAVLPTSGGCAVFVGNSDKVFIVYVDQTVGSAITMFMREMSKERPLTHDLMAHLMTAVGAHVERVIINDLKNATYYARMIIAAENELQQKKIIELDARPSDCIAMATQQKAPIYVSQEVWDEVEDMSDVLRKMEEEGLKPEIDPESEATEEE
jgi:bifunctional DNase/RNase